MLVWIVGCLNSLNILLTGRPPKKSIILSRVFLETGSLKKMTVPNSEKCLDPDQNTDLANF
jgi:hypothetical protein